MTATAFILVPRYIHTGMYNKLFISPLANLAASIGVFLLTLFITGFATSSFANTLYWVGDTNDATVSTPTSGTWDVSTTLSWNTTGTGTTNSTWVTGDAADFGGSSGSGFLAIDLTANVNCAMLTFSNGGYTISAATPEMPRNTCSSDVWGYIDTLKSQITPGEGSFLFSFVRRIFP